MAESRAPGWYPDPWGTDGERYFDGAAWGRESRPAGGDPAPVPGGTTTTTPPALSPPDTAGGPPTLVPVPVLEPGSPGSGASAGSATAAGSGHGAAETAPTVPGVAPAGWHPDPWGLAAVRWWDGAAWTGYVSGPPAAQGRPVDVVGERVLARRAGPALVVGGIAAAAGQVAGVDQAVWFADNWDALTRASGPVPRVPVTTASTIGQYMFMISIAVAVFFLMWFYRAAANAWASGLPARRSPVLAMLSFLIPVVSLWWPYQSTLDLVPADDPRRKVIGYWWVAYLLGSLCGLLTIVAAFVSGRTAAQVVAVIGGVAMIAAGVLARTVVEYVTAVHEAAAARPAGE